MKRPPNLKALRTLRSLGSSLSLMAILSSSATFSLRLLISTISCYSTRTNLRFASSARCNRMLAVHGSGSTSRSHLKYKWASSIRKRLASTQGHFSKSSSANSTSPSRRSRTAVKSQNAFSMRRILSRRTRHSIIKLLARRVSAVSRASSDASAYKMANSLPSSSLSPRMSRRGRLSRTKSESCRCHRTIQSYSATKLSTTKTASGSSWS